MHPRLTQTVWSPGQAPGRPRGGGGEAVCAQSLLLVILVSYTTFTSRS